MTDLVITVANVDWVSGTKKTKDAAETITAGDAVYLATTTTVGVATNADTAKDEVVGLALNDATAGHPVTYAMDGAVVAFGAILGAGEMYVMSAAGAISAVADQATNDYVSFLGYGLSTTQMKLTIINTGLQSA